MLSKSSIALLLIGASLAAAQVTVNKPCDPTMTALEINGASDLLGTFYEQIRYPQPSEENSRCNKATYSANEDGSVKVVNSLIQPNETEYRLEGSATFAVSPNVGKLNVQLNGVPVTASLWVVAAELDSWRLLWSCTNMPDGTSRVGAFGLTNLRNPPSSVIQKLIDASISKKIDIMNYVVADQTNC